ncbi:2-polyprenyl-6-methoxyphenol hydroxylase-like FAD-dependent oxidoreductase [Agromyces sp. 3263]|uniref:FAD-dependent monooxygenase n=1 Tax=Agromyces sp. 3263 TaxID=2817750 RepID=UPI002858BF2F|nr:FAD-dependent monooxygenase [Agromyces sp. 3263]MDR6906360.1 2-polyprenyl-6-methoxyphenol hydroxylase-like FAD-dependent oxidoreductase [Agromyces sp. 3263]
MKVLISGGGIAGLTAAHALSDGGHDVTVVELAPDLRPGGQLVDLRGTSREAAARMGLLEAITAAQLPQRGMRYVDDRGRTLAELGVEMFGGQGPVADLEILRGDLTRVLFEVVAGRVDLRFGESIAALSADDDGVDVAFEHGGPERFDLVVAADGLHSRVRRLVWGPEADYVRSLGGVTSFFDVPEPEPLDGWSLMDILPGRRMVMIRPDAAPGRSKAIVTWFGEHDLPDRRDVDAQKQLVRSALADGVWHLPALSAALDTTSEFYFDALVQVHTPELSRGRVVLLGDAGYCTSPLSGQGTALALIGAYLLASELGRRSDRDVVEALAAYEREMAPHIEAGRELPPGSGSFATPKSRLGIRVLHGYIRLSARRPLLTVVEKAMSSRHDVPLPAYDAVGV